VFKDGFRAARQIDGHALLRLDDETIPMVLRYKDVRQAAKDWHTFSSDAPFRVPIPSEEHERSVRQLPIETDSPQHKAYRALLEPFFRKPAAEEYVERLDRLIKEMLQHCSAMPECDIVRQFALPVQSRALTYLLGMPEDEADIWVSWGTHVFRDGEDSSEKGSVLEQYLTQKIAEARAAPESADFFSAMTRMSVDGRPVTDEEALGMANLVFAGGRDTVINAISVIIHHFAHHRDVLREVAADQKSINLAVEEFVRIISPLTHIGRACKADAEVASAQVKAEQRISLCWASANYDPDIFQSPETLQLDRAPNPHVGFGSGHHACLGALQARAILRALIRGLAQHTTDIDILDAVPNIETYGTNERLVGYEKLTAWLKA
jgi:cytochrome P450